MNVLREQIKSKNRIYGTVSKIKRSIDVLRKNDKLIGLAGGMSDEAIGFWSDLGIDMLFSGVDWEFMYTAAKQTLDTMKKY